MKRRIFLVFTGSNDRAVFALLRAFRACEVEFVLIARNDDDKVLSSAYRDRVLVTRDQEGMSQASFEGLLAKVRETVPDDELVVVPSSEYLNTFMLGLDSDDLRARLGCEVSLVDRDLYMTLSNKSSSVELFAAAGIRVPARIGHFEAGALPLVAKPSRNVGDDGVVRYPQLLRTPAELAAFQARDDVSLYFAQEFIAGRSEYLLAYIARTGDVFLTSQLNIAQQPHGKSIVLARTSGFHHAPVARESITLLRRMGFHGLAMIEFIIDDAGPCFIEMNPRPWGPLQLCLDHACGIVEAFIGDELHGEPLRHERLWKNKPAQARYLWLGGMAEAWFRHESLRWNPATRLHGAQIAASLPSDVYLGRDTWKVFLQEIRGQ